jgi:hypothetical protein
MVSMASNSVNPESNAVLAGIDECDWGDLQSVAAELLRGLLAASWNIRDECYSELCDVLNERPDVAYLFMPFLAVIARDGLHGRWYAALLFATALTLGERTAMGDVALRDRVSGWPDSEIKSWVVRALGESLSPELESELNDISVNVQFMESEDSVAVSLPEILRWVQGLAYTVGDAMVGSDPNRSKIFNIIRNADKEELQTLAAAFDRVPISPWTASQSCDRSIVKAIVAGSLGHAYTIPPVGIADDGGYYAALGWARTCYQSDPPLATAVLSAAARETHGPCRALWVLVTQAQGKVEEARQQALQLANEWLGPPAVGALNQSLYRNDILAMFAALPQDDEISAQVSKITASDEPEFAFPDGDCI